MMFHINPHSHLSDFSVFIQGFRCYAKFHRKRRVTRRRGRCVVPESVSSDEGGFITIWGCGGGGKDGGVKRREEQEEWSHDHADVVDETAEASPSSRSAQRRQVQNVKHPNSDLPVETHADHWWRSPVWMLHCGFSYTATVIFKHWTDSVKIHTSALVWVFFPGPNLGR